MAQFLFKNLPEGFEFPFTRREMRAFIRSSPATFDTVEFAGIASSEKAVKRPYSLELLFVCYLRAEYSDSSWHFMLRIEGLRVERFEERREEIAQALWRQIEQWIEAKLALPVTAPKKSCRAHVYFNLSQNPESIAALTEWD